MVLFLQQDTREGERGGGVGARCGFFFFPFPPSLSGRRAECDVDASDGKVPDDDDGFCFALLVVRVLASWLRAPSPPPPPPQPRCSGEGEGCACVLLLEEEEEKADRGREGSRQVGWRCPSPSLGFRLLLLFGGGGLRGGGGGSPWLGHTWCYRSGRVGVSPLSPPSFPPPGG